MREPCHICHAIDWLPLPDPAASRSVTTSSRIVDQPLGKHACGRCGFVQRATPEFLGQGAYYENDYASYYERPGTEAFHRKRYLQLADWMSRYLNPEAGLDRVLDVGCGQGWAMDAMRSSYPGLEICGLEPSTHNAAIARGKGYTVLAGKLEDTVVAQKFDLIYSNNVIQHVNDARGFLQGIRELLSDDGVMIVTCPDGSRANIELLFSDHNYSFLPANLTSLGAELGLATMLWSASDEHPALPPAQLLLLTNGDRHTGEATPAAAALPSLAVEQANRQRLEYIEAMSRLRAFLAEQTAGYPRVYNFGASFWTSVLAAYCPEYWQRVEACLVDVRDTATEFMGKAIMALDEVPAMAESAIVLGTSPATHPALTAKLGADRHVVGWHSFYSY